MAKKVRLDIAPAVAVYATQHGAQYDKENGWYCFEPVPLELEEFVNAADKIKKQYIEKYMQCPICGGQMHLKPTSDGRIFWGCMSYPRCKGSRSVNETKDGHFKRVLKAVPEKGDNFISNTHQNFRELVELGLRELGHQKEFENWLAKPKVALNGKRPIEVINTDEGYNKVMDLLTKVNL